MIDEHRRVLAVAKADWKFPLFLLILGLGIHVGLVARQSGERMIQPTLIRDGISLAVQVPIVVAILIIIGRLFSMSYGTLGLVALKVAGIEAVSNTMLGYLPVLLSHYVAANLVTPVTIAVVFITVAALFVKLFDLNVGQAIVSVILVAVLSAAAHHVITRVIHPISTHERSYYPRRNR